MALGGPAQFAFDFGLADAGRRRRQRAAAFAKPPGPSRQSAEIDIAVARCVATGDYDGAVRALWPVVATVARKFETSIGFDEAVGVAQAKLAEALRKWDPQRGSARPFVAVSMERACISHIRAERRRQADHLGETDDQQAPEAQTTAAGWTAMVAADPCRSCLPGLDTVMAMPCSALESEAIGLAVTALIAGIAPVYVRARPYGEGVEWLDESLRAVFA